MIITEQSYNNMVRKRWRFRNDITRECNDITRELSFKWAIQNGDTEIVKRLIEEGTNVNDSGDKGMDDTGAVKTPLIVACENGFTEIVSLLLDKGANVNMTDYWKRSALMFACQKGYIEIVSILLWKGADANAIMRDYDDRRSWTALDIAKYHLHKEIVSLIVNHQRRPELKKQILKIALVIKKGLTQKKDKLLMLSAQRDMIYHIASFF